MAIWSGQNFLVRINSTVVPADNTGLVSAWPQRVEVHYPETTTRTLNGMPAGYASWPFARFSWPDGMTATAYNWWLAYTSTGVVLTDLVVPDPEQGDDIVHDFGGAIGEKTYLLHSEWNSGIMHRITRGPGSISMWRSGAQWISGPLSVLISRLGGGS